MESTIPNAAAPEPENLSPPARIAAVFAQPSRAWGGLRERTQWWIPLLIVTLISGLSAALLHQRAVVPMVLDQMEEQVASGDVPPQQLERLEAFFSTPAGMAITVGQQIVLIPIVTFVVGLLVWFGAGFVLGTDFRYRFGLEVAAWSSLINIPALLLTTGIAWVRETMQGVHVGFGILLPEVDAPSKLMIGLGVFLDGIGPFAIWYLTVGVIGAAALSGAPRKNVAWVLAGLYIVFLALMSALAAMFAR